MTETWYLLFAKRRRRYVAAAKYVSRKGLVLGWTPHPEKALLLPTELAANRIKETLPLAGLTLVTRTFRTPLRLDQPEPPEETEA